MKLSGESGTRPATARDVAALAGVSTATVSFVVNGQSERYSSETAARVNRAITLLDYRPNHAARQLKTRRSHVMGLVGSRIAAGAFGGDMIQGAQDFALANGLTVLVIDTGAHGEALESALDVMTENQVGGVLVASVMTSTVDVPLSLYGGPTVFVNCNTRDPNVKAILPDDEAGGMRATEILIAHGHRRIALLSGERGTLPALARESGFRRALENAGLGCEDDQVSYGNWNADTGYTLAMQQLTSSMPPTALFCGNDRMAVGAYFAILELGLAVGKDVSVMGYDNQTELAAFAHPSLSSIQLPYYEMGWRAAEALASGDAHGVEVVDCVPVLRESVKRVAVEA